jgi:hypothetical protein
MIFGTTHLSGRHMACLAAALRSQFLVVCQCDAFGRVSPFLHGTTPKPLIRPHFVVGSASRTTARSAQPRLASSRDGVGRAGSGQGGALRVLVPRRPTFLFARRDRLDAHPAHHGRHRVLAHQCPGLKTHASLRISLARRPSAKICVMLASRRRDSSSGLSPIWFLQQVVSAPFPSTCSLWLLRLARMQTTLARAAVTLPSPDPE